MSTILLGMIEPFEYPASERQPVQDRAPIAQETASAAPTLCTEYGPSG